MANSFSKKIAEALDPSRKKTKITRKKDTSSDREKELSAKENSPKGISRDELKELLTLKAARRATKK